jgi:pantoate--beta-alanine ligase
MDVLETVSDLREALAGPRRGGRKIGLVPTMGSLHEAHFSLIRAARAECDTVVASIFVNPTQFGPGEDLELYPRTPELDARGCEQEGVDLLFTPPVEGMYPPGFQTKVTVEEVSREYCGRYRPGHFPGVATVVLKLLNIVQPHAAYFGEKDFQQSAVIRRMVGDLNIPVEIRLLPIVREPDGLAMSSRNRYLSGSAREAATVLFRSLEAAAERVRAGERSAAAVLKTVREVFEGEPAAQLQYAGVADDETLEPVESIRGREHLLLAAFVGDVRLIDNRSFEDALG